MLPRLTIVMPAYDEEECIEQAVRSAAGIGGELAGPCEVVAVDDGSRDGTWAILESLARELGPSLRTIRFERNRGYGAALRAGFGAARSPLVFYTDSDNQFDLRELAQALPLIEERDAVLGYRIGRQDPPLRRLTSKVFNVIVSLSFGVSVRDLNCSFKLFRRDVLSALQLVSDDFFIDTEMVVRLHTGGWRCVEHGVRHYPRSAGRSTVRPGDVPRTVAAILRMRRLLGGAPATAERRT
jgi:glycosyltransferase involved in cell wall biosynthesis